MSVLTDLRNRGVKDTFFVVCDDLKALSEVVGELWPRAVVQTCIIHLIRKLPARLQAGLGRAEARREADLHRRERRRRPAALEELTEKWGTKYGPIIRLWNNAWEEFIPFLDHTEPVAQSRVDSAQAVRPATTVTPT
jgi:putative transposase